jgi:hypothetical protein
MERENEDDDWVLTAVAFGPACDPLAKELRRLSD